ncbi:MAG: hypothetical protein ACKO7W_10530 [Elainella sp.]
MKTQSEADFTVNWLPDLQLSGMIGRLQRIVIQQMAVPQGEGYERGLQAGRQEEQVEQSR